MKYWKFKSGGLFLFLVFTDKALLFGSYSENTVIKYVSHIVELQKAPRQLKGIKLLYIKSVIKGLANQSLKITLNKGTYESIEFNNQSERDIILMS